MRTEVVNFVRKYAMSIALVLVAVTVALMADVVITTQNDRADSILRSCQDQNVRHDRTVAELDQVLGEARKHAKPALVRTLVTTRASTVLLIDALAPHQNCQRVLAKATS